MRRSAWRRAAALSGLMTCALCALADEPAPAGKPAGDSPAAAPAAPAPARSTRTAEQILREYDSITLPRDPLESRDEKVWDEFLKAKYALLERYTELGPELYAVDPMNARAGELLGKRWQLWASELHSPEKIAPDAERYIAEDKNAGVVTEALYWSAIGVGRVQKFDYAPTMNAVNRFVAYAPKDERAPNMLFTMANKSSSLTDYESNKRAAEIFRRIMREYPESEPGQAAPAMLKVVEGLGNPFELKFKDAITGKDVDIQQMKGKVVVIDFWATWCAPCVADMRTLKKLYADYQSQGLEIVGVSLDNTVEQGGLEALKGYVQKEGITWPQYYQGGGTMSEFSSAWGIPPVPRVFLIDAEGKLVDTNARGALEHKVKMLMARRDAGKK